MSLKGMRALSHDEKVALYDRLCEQASDRGPDGQGYDYGSEIWEMQHPWADFEKELRMIRCDQPGALGQEMELTSELGPGNLGSQNEEENSGEPPAKKLKLGTESSAPGAGAGVRTETTVRGRDEVSRGGITAGFRRGRARRGRRGNQKHYTCFTSVVGVTNLKCFICKREIS